MNKLTVGKNGSKEKRGLKIWENIDINPFDLFLRRRHNLHREVDRLFEDFWQNGESLPLLSPWSENILSPLVDETEDEQAYHIEVELPGIDKEDVDVSYCDGLLTISGEKREEKEEKKRDYYRKERSFGAFRRVVPLPGAIDESKIHASFKRGILSIDLPKTDESKKKVKKISVSAA